MQTKEREDRSHEVSSIIWLEFDETMERLKIRMKSLGEQMDVLEQKIAEAKKMGGDMRYTESILQRISGVSASATRSVTRLFHLAEINKTILEGVKS